MNKQEIINRAAVRMAQEYERRTRLIAADDKSVSTYWIDPASRVAWSEFCVWLRDFGWPMAASGISDVVDARLAAQPVVNRELRKRGLLGVIRGKVTSDQFVERTKTTEPGRLRCPLCGGRGVQLWQRAQPGEDGYACRYCDFECFTSGYDLVDRNGRAALALTNPGRHISGLRQLADEEALHD